MYSGTDLALWTSFLGSKRSVCDVDRQRDRYLADRVRPVGSNSFSWLLVPFPKYLITYHGVHLYTSHRGTKTAIVVPLVYWFLTVSCMYGVCPLLISSITCLIRLKSDWLCSFFLFITISIRPYVFDEVSCRLPPPPRTALGQMAGMKVQNVNVKKVWKCLSFFLAPACYSMAKRRPTS